MGYNVAIKLTESVTKAVVRLLKYMRNKFYRNFEGKLYNETERNLKVFVRWFGGKLDKIYNPIAVFLEFEERKKLKKEQKSLKKSNLPKDGYIIEHFH